MQKYKVCKREIDKKALAARFSNYKNALIRKVSKKTRQQTIHSMQYQMIRATFAFQQVES